MSAHVKIWGKEMSQLVLFRKEFSKFNNTGAPMLDSTFHMTLKVLKNHIFGNVKI